MNFGEKLKKLREEKELTQEDLGKILNLSKANISKYESGKVEPNIQTIRLISEFFKVSVDYLLNINIKDNHPVTSTFKIDNAVSDDPELQEFYKEMQQRESLKLLFNQTKNLNDKDIKQILRIIKAIEDEEDKNDC